MSKKIIAIVCVVVVLCSSLVIPALAYVDAPYDSALDATNFPVMNTSSAEAFQNSVVRLGYNNSGKYQGASMTQAVKDYYVENDAKFYFALVNNYNYIFSNVNIDNPRITYGENYDFRSEWQYSGNFGYSHPVVYDNDTELYYSYGYEALDNWTSLVPSFNDVPSALSAAASAISGGSSSISVNQLDIPAGNVAYIKTNGVQTLNLTTTFIQYSQLFSDTWANVTQKVSWESNLPTGTVTFPLNGMASLQWSKTGNTNILGQTQNASASYQTTNNQYFVIYNPLYQQYGQGDNYDMNGTIHVNGEMIEVKVYPLSGSVVTGQGLVSNSESGYDDYYELQDDGNGNLEWVDQNGNVSTGPQTGGTSLLPQEATIQTLASQILNIITKVGQSIANIFNVGHQAIVTLVGHASEFVTHFQSLYTWLPADIFAVLSSAIILAITIGIIKVFI